MRHLYDEIKANQKKNKSIKTKPMSKKLQNSDLEALAKKWNVELAAIQAVVEVESPRGGFDNEGRPIILFEGHVFWRELRSRNINPYDHIKGNENILYRKWTRKHYSKGRLDVRNGLEHKRLQKAVKINREAALESASYGMFQVLGSNWKSLGYESVQEFINDMFSSEQGHLNAFARFVETNNLVDELQQKRWADFARRYNGPGYKKNRYDTKMENAYKKYKKLGF